MEVEFIDTVKTVLESSEAAKAAANNIDLEVVGNILLKFLILSVVFEVALNPIFTWRVFLARFEGKGYKIPIIVVLAFLVFWGYKLDIIRDILVAIKVEPEGTKHTGAGQLLTALLIAGGSSGFVTIFGKLGIRNPAAVKQKAEEAAAQLAEKKAKQNGAGDQA